MVGDEKPVFGDEKTKGLIKVTVGVSPRANRQGPKESKRDGTSEQASLCFSCRTAKKERFPAETADPKVADLFVGVKSQPENRGHRCCFLECFFEQTECMRRMRSDVPLRVSFSELCAAEQDHTRICLTKRLQCQEMCKVGSLRRKPTDAPLLACMA